MKVEKDEIYYYIDNIDNTDTVVVKLQALRDAEGVAALPFRVVKYIIGKPDFVGFPTAVQVGSNISSNQLNGVGLIGAERYIFNKHKTIKKIFNL